MGVGRERPALASLLSDAGRGEFDIVVVHSLDRWSRDFSMLFQTLQLLGNHGVGFVTLQEDFDLAIPYCHFSPAISEFMERQTMPVPRRTQPDEK